VVVDYVYRRGHFVVVLAVASQTWDWADARGCHPEVVREGVSVSVYVDVGVVYGFVVDSAGSLGGFFCLCGALVVVLAALAFPCFVIGLVRFVFGCLPTALAFPCFVSGLCSGPMVLDTSKGDNSPTEVRNEQTEHN
jgi:hypothetical protein